MKEKLSISRKKRNRQFFPLFITIFLTVWCVVFLCFFAWGLMTAFKSSDNYIVDSLGFPKKEEGGWQISNFIIAFQKMGKGLVSGRDVPIYELIWNTLFYCLVYGFCGVLFPMITSYVYAKYGKRVRWTKFIWVIVLFNMYVPISASLATVLLMTMRMGIYDNIYLFVVTSMSGFGGCFLIYYATWKGLSWEYAEAAFIDGASHFQVFVKIMFPMTMTIFTVLYTTQVIGLWHQYETILVYLPSYPTLAAGIFQFAHKKGMGYSAPPIKMASLVSLAVPMMIVFVLMKDKMMGSLTIGGLKG